MSFPEHLRYTEEHEWLDTEGDIATIGVTEYAASSLGDIVFVQLPAVGDTVARGETCGEIESTKSVSDLYSPVSGAVVEVNDAVLDGPEVVNTDPYGKGWLFRVRVEEVGELLDAAAYAALTNA
ncbi:glycine cleavage system protein GcvH [Nocardia sp. CDC159]|uniref:Glycine cleavage system H protein n=1 Tax=Nocardia pulmonis TaxID=2951408 RepID=A0A9X2IZT6_9NOCA|nr:MULTISPECIES: glycine cleavage system protein GcvH [Nocardia]MCM6775301.1 glycine cleavage system protein GcvH [Nocardia pulmonis]MCM6787965.1 glycine cleavage system protein GcvH [Nocardia sp. CDC159]